MKWNEDKVEKYIQEIEQKEGEEFHCFRNDVERELEDGVVTRSTIAVKIISIFGGVFAALLLLLFLFISRVLDSEMSSIILGLAIIAVALIIENQLNNRTWSESFCLSFYAVGYILFWVGMYSMELGDYWDWIFGAIIPAVVICISRSYIVVFLSMIAVCVCLWGLLARTYIPGISIVFTVLVLFAFIWMTFNEAKLYTKEQLKLRYSPLQAGLFVALSYYFIRCIIAGRYGETVSPYTGAFSLSVWAAILWLVPKILRKLSGEEEIPISKKRKYYLISFLILLPTLFAPAISGAILLLLLSFYFNYKSQFVASIVLLTYSIIQYYYDLGFSLLIKSGLLFFSGLLFLALWFVFNKKKL